MVPLTPYSDFLLGKLGIPIVKVPMSGTPNSSPRPVTFQDFMRVLYMDQKNSFQEILNKVQPEWYKTKIIQILLGLSNEEVDNLNLQIQELSTEIEQRERENENISNFLKKSARLTRLEMIGRRDKIKSEITAIESEISAVKQQMRGVRGITDEIREKYEVISHSLLRLSEEKAKILYKLQDYHTLLNSLLMDRDKILKTTEANHVISSVEFVKCPRCLQKINSEMRRREELHTECMLCGRPLPLKPATTKVVKDEKVVDEEIKEVKILTVKYEERCQQLDKEIKSLEESRLIVQQDLDKATREYVSPFVDELERLLLSQNSKSAELESIGQALNQWNLHQENIQRLEQLKIQKNKLILAVRSTDQTDTQKVTRFSEYYEQFLRNINFKGLQSAYIRANDLMPVINNHHYLEDTGIGTTSVKIIAYHVSLMRLSLDVPCYYPKFLMIDSPRQFDINQDTYRKMLLQFYEVQKESEKLDFQIILTTRDLPEEMEQYVIERLNSRTRMLLRVEGQREQSRN